jgi:hypothetical protein
MSLRWPNQMECSCCHEGLADQTDRVHYIPPASGQGRSYRVRRGLQVSMGDTKAQEASNTHQDPAEPRESTPGTAHTNSLLQKEIVNCRARTTSPDNCSQQIKLEPRGLAATRC